MLRHAPRIVWVSAGLALAGCGGGSASDASPFPDARIRYDAPVASCTPRSGSTVVVTPVTNVPDLPVFVAFAPGADPRLFIVERSGAIQIYDNGALIETPFLDISDNRGGPVLADGEQGLLGLAFHQDYETNRKFYVYYTTSDANVVAEYQTTATDRNVADPDSARVILSIGDFASNHNGGMINFGRDGYLYIGTGDGGNGDDPQENGQDANELLAKILRIDVDHAGGGREYGIPAENPYVAGGGAPEVLIKGVRNPWRWSFDRVTDDLYIGDVGQEIVEEIDVVAYADMAGLDLGWDDCEGSLDFEGKGCATPTGARRRPAFEQIRPPVGSSPFEAIVGGAVYRSVCFPDLVGRYFFTDNTAGGLWSFVWSGGQATDVITHPGSFPASPTSISMDAFGELYLAAGNGDIVRIEAQ